MGLPEELTEEEKAAEAAAAAKKAEAVNKKKAAFVSVKPITGLALSSVAKPVRAWGCTQKAR